MLAKDNPVSYNRCKRCGKQFKSGLWNPVKYCSKKCKNTRFAEGYYVYGWYYVNERLPFYVGKGRSSRAWRDSRAASVKIYRDGLTEEGAYLVESVLIDLFLSLGARLRNRRKGLRRQERPPLSK